MKNKTKKIMSLICLIMIFIAYLPLQTFAVFITDINSNAQFGVISGSLGNYGHELHYANYDGQTYIAFCTQYGAKSPNGKDYVYNGDFIVNYKNNLPQYKKIAEMIYFGYTMNYGYGIPQSADAIRAACCTQQYVWEYIHNNINASTNYPGRDSWNGNYMSTGHLAEWTARTEWLYNQYHGNTSFNGTTTRVALGQSTLINDSTGRLASYQSFNQNINGVTFKHDQGSNDLIIVADSNTSVDTVTFESRNYGLYQLMPNGRAYDASTMSNYIYIQFTSGAVQNLMISNYVDPSAFSINVQVEYGNTLVIKTNMNGDTLAGCTFGLYKDENCTQLLRKGISDNQGNLFFQRLAPGYYYVKELSVPEGYLLDNSVKIVNIKVNETAEVSFKNEEPTGEIKLIKTDKETGRENKVDGTSHHGDATLNGTEYTLYSNEDIYNVANTVKYFSKDEEIATYTFDSNGIANIKVTTKSTNTKLTVDGNILKGLPMGVYYSKETKVPDGYLQDTQIHIHDLKYKDMNTKIINYEETLLNQVQKAKIEIIKISSNDNTTAEKIANAEFTLILSKYVNYYGSFNEALKYLCEFAEDEYDVLKTDENGHAVSKLLAYGLYEGQETYTPSDEIETVEPFYINIDKNSDGVIKEFVENDLPFESYLKFIKIDKDTGKKVIFSNTTFKLSKLNEETNEWEKVKCKTGIFSHDTWKTNNEAVACTQNKLKSGTYKLDEVITPKGFLELEEPIIFKINRNNETLEMDEDYDAYITVTVGNEQPTGTLIVDKTIILNDNIDISLVDKSNLSGIEFKLQAKEKVIDYADGSTMYEKGQVVKTFNLDETGKYKLENLPMGTYELIETKTLNGLILDAAPIEVKFEKKDNTTKVYTKEIKIENKPTVFEFSKTDITGDKELPGAELRVLDIDRKIIDTWTSSDKTHKIEGLEIGKTYILEETIAPNGYVKATSIEFKVENTSNIQKVTMIDKIVKISKTDLITGEELEGAELEIIEKETKESIDKWISKKEPHIVNGLEEGKEYILRETTCPYGYEIAEEIIFTVTSDKETQKIEMKDMPILKNIKVVKIDEKTKEIITEKFTFGIYEDSECKNLIKEIKSNNDTGYVLFENLRFGTYYIRETIAPKGYELSTKVVKVEINDKGIFVDDEQVQENDNTIEFNFENREIEVPNTGVDSKLKLFIGSAILSLLGIVYIIIKFLKKRGE